MIRKLTLVIFSLGMLASGLQAQQLGLYFMDGLWQANEVNPAFLPERRTIYSFPNIYVNMHNNVASYNDLITTDGDGKTVLDLDPVIQNLSEEGNIISGNLDVQTFSASFGTKIWRGSVSHTFRTRTLTAFPKALPNLLWNGNAPFIGQTMNIAPSVQVMSYSELALGFGLNVYKFTFGGRLKVLSGIFDASTDRNRATVHTDEDIYQLSFETDYSFNVAALADYGNLDDFEPEFDISAFSPNFGLGLDLGVKYRYSDQLTLSASIIDLGAINWKTNAKNFASRGSYTYGGEDIASTIRDSLSFEETLDTLESIFDFQESEGSYSTALPFKSYWGASYRINQFFRVGGLIYAERYRKTTIAGLAINGGVDLGKVFSGGLVYSMVKGTYDNLGLNAAVRLGPVQLYAVFDNTLAFFRPFDSQRVNARFGLNLAFK